MSAQTAAPLMTGHLLTILYMSQPNPKMRYTHSSVIDQGGYALSESVPTQRKMARPAQQRNACPCADWENGVEHLGLHHDKRCDKYKTEKHGILVFWDESRKAYVTTSKEFDVLKLARFDTMAEGDTSSITLHFKSVYLTDEEFEQFPFSKQLAPDGY